MVASDTGIKGFIIKWFSDNTHRTREELEALLDADYLRDGSVDSFKFISFIAEAEEAFGIRFDNSDFQNQSFATMSGLIKIIKSKIYSSHDA